MAKKINFFVVTLLILIMLIGLITFIFKMSGWKFYLGFLILLGILLLALLSVLLVYNDVKGGYMLAAIISLVALLYFSYIYLKKYILTTLILSVMAASVTALVVSLVNIGEKKEKKKCAEPVQKEEPKEKKPVITTYTPGKVVSSKTSAYYHIPECDWAKKIMKSNQTWFETDEEAKKTGLKPHNCIK